MSDTEEYTRELIGLTIKDITDNPNSPGIIIEFTTGTKLRLWSGAFGGFKQEIIYKE